MFKLFKSNVGEPVLTLVELIKNNPERFAVVISKTGAVVVVDRQPKGLNFWVGYVCGFIPLNSDSISWMSKSELRYIYKEIKPYAKVRENKSPRDKWKEFYCGDKK